VSKDTAKNEDSKLAEKKGGFVWSALKALLLVVLAVGLVVLVLFWNGYYIPYLSKTPLPPPAGPKQSAILAPAQDVKVVVGSPVQIQSVHVGNNISRVELWIQGQRDEAAKLVRSDTPTKGIVRQELIPQEVGVYTVTVQAYAGEAAQPPLTRRLEAVQTVVSLPPQSVPSMEDSASSLTPPTATAIAAPGGEPAAAIAEPTAVMITVVTEGDTAAPAPVSPPTYPPPPPIPGVPPGLTQDQMPAYGPPVCDAAEYVGVYGGSTSRRIQITEADDVAAKSVGGTTVFRAWRLQNIGTCTWGPGYELAFYGGRSMGSGGVAFESTFPADPPQRNVVIETNRLVVPEGKPNQTAVVEVMLNVPSTPGIHQSYWRMRNPQGIFFGPIVGVTLDVVRDCQFGAYGAPTVNRLEILGVGDVYQPIAEGEIPTVWAEFGDPVTLDWDIINATNFDLVFESPTGEVQSTSTTDTNGRATFVPRQLGEHRITLYADNGICTTQQQVLVVAIPPEDEQFRLRVILAGSNATAGSAATSSTGVGATSAGDLIGYSTSVAPGDVKIEWAHFDNSANNFTLYARTYKQAYELYCPGGNKIPWLDWQLDAHCYETWSDWKPTGPPEPVSIPDSNAKGAATITNIEDKSCPASYDPTRTRYVVKYTMQAKIDGRAAQPEYSNVIEVPCPSSGSQPFSGDDLP
jgi:hypothetical protein